MKHDDAVYLKHILDAIARVEEYLSGVDEAAFHEHHLIQDGVIRQTEIVGEAVKNLSSELRQAHSTVPWEDIAGMRDKLIHHYFGVDLGVVWLTTQEDLPILKAQVTTILAEISGGSPGDIY